MSEGYLVLIDTLLENRLKKGEWFFFGDYDFQTIYNYEISNDKVVEMLEDCASFAMFNLTTNCRNTPNIQQEMNKLFNLEIKTFNKDKSMPEVEYIAFHDENEELNLLTDKLAELIRNGVKKEDITILSPFRFEKSIASKVTKYKIGKAGLNSNNTTYSTIQGFKGLKNSVIILTDIKSYKQSDLMYVGMSRARKALIIFESVEAKKYRK